MNNFRLEHLSGRAEAINDSLRDFSSSFRGVVSFILALLLVGYAPIAVGANYVVDGRYTSELAIPLLISMFCGSRLVQAFHVGRLEPMRVGFLVFTYFFLGLAPIAQITSRDFPQLYNVQHADLVNANIICATGLVAWEVVYLLSRNSVVPPWRAIDISDRTVVNFAIVSIVISVLFAGAVNVSLFESREDFTNKVESVFGTLTTTGNIALALGTIPILLSSLALSVKYRFDRAWLPLLILALSLTALVSNPLSSPRFWVGTVALALALGLGAGGGKAKRLRLVLIVFVLGFVILFPIASAFRYSNASEPTTLGGLTEQLVGEDFDSYQQIATGVVYVSDEGFQDGGQVGTSLAFFVPRSIWPSKPYGTGEEIGLWAGYKFTNLSAPLWLEGYVDFGYVGVVSFMGLLAYISSRLDKAFSRSVVDGMGEGWFVVVPVLAFYQLLLLRGSLLVVMPRLAMIGLSMLLLTSRTSDSDRVTLGRTK